jgi:hypothetical protein
MAQIPPNNDIAHVVVGELRVRFIGGLNPLAKMSFMDPNGNTVSFLTYGAWSERSLQILHALKESIEDDVAAHLTRHTPPPAHRPLDDDPFDEPPQPSGGLSFAG